MWLLCWLSGARCSEACVEGQWGPHCNHSCSQHCPHGDRCHPETSACVCRHGYWGPACEKSKWWTGRHGNGTHSCMRMCWWSLSSCQDAVPVGMVTSAVLPVRPAGSRSTVIMWPGSVTVRSATPDRSVIRVPTHTHTHTHTPRPDRQIYSMIIYYYGSIYSSIYMVVYIWFVVPSVSVWVLRYALCWALLWLQQQLHLRPAGRTLWM